MYCVLFDKVRNEGLISDRTAVKKEYSIVEFLFLYFLQVKDLKYVYILRRMIQWKVIKNPLE